MKKFLAVILAIFALPLLAVEINNIEYQLPAEKILKPMEVKNEYMDMKLYYSEDENMEVFGVALINTLEDQVIDFSNQEFDEASIKDTIASICPDLEINFRVLEKNSSAITVEWDAQLEDAAFLGLAKVLLCDDQKFLSFIYLTDEFEIFEQNKCEWMDTINTAKLTN